MKGAHAEEKYLLMGILSGYIVKSYMSVTGMFYMILYWLSVWDQRKGGVLRNEENLCDASLALAGGAFYVLCVIIINIEKER